MRATPLRAAFWAITAALGLTLFRALTDPYAVRQSLLAQHESRVPPRWDATPARTRDPDPSPTPADDVPPPLLTAETSLPPLPASSSPILVDATPVSTAAQDDREEPGRSSTIVRPAMPIFSPDRTDGSRRRGEFVPLPPPPGMHEDVAASPTVNRLPAPAVTLSPHVEPPLAASTQDPKPQQFWDLQQMQRLLLQQESLLESQRETTARLERLAEQIEIHTLTLEALADQRPAPVTATPIELDLHAPIIAPRVAGPVERLQSIASPETGEFSGGPMFAAPAPTYDRR